MINFICRKKTGRRRLQTSIFSKQRRRTTRSSRVGDDFEPENGETSDQTAGGDMIATRPKFVRPPSLPVAIIRSKRRSVARRHVHRVVDQDGAPPVNVRRRSTRSVCREMAHASSQSSGSTEQTSNDDCESFEKFNGESTLVKELCNSTNSLNSNNCSSLATSSNKTLFKANKSHSNSNAGKRLTKQRFKKSTLPTSCRVQKRQPKRKLSRLLRSSMTERRKSLRSYDTGMLTLEKHSNKTRKANRGTSLSVAESVEIISQNGNKRVPKVVLATLSDHAISSKELDRKSRDSIAKSPASVEPVTEISEIEVDKIVSSESTSQMDEHSKTPVALNMATDASKSDIAMVQNYDFEFQSDDMPRSPAELDLIATSSKDVAGEMESNNIGSRFVGPVALDSAPKTSINDASLIAENDCKVSPSPARLDLETSLKENANVVEDNNFESQSTDTLKLNLASETLKDDVGMIENNDFESQLSDNLSSLTEPDLATGTSKENVDLDMMSDLETQSNESFITSRKLDLMVETIENNANVIESTDIETSPNRKSPVMKKKWFDYAVTSYNDFPSHSPDLISDLPETNLSSDKSHDVKTTAGNFAVNPYSVSTTAEISISSNSFESGCSTLATSQSKVLLPPHRQMSLKQQINKASKPPDIARHSYPCPNKKIVRQPAKLRLKESHLYLPSDANHHFGSGPNFAVSSVYHRWSTTIGNSRTLPPLLSCVASTCESYTMQCPIPASSVTPHRTVPASRCSEMLSMQKDYPNSRKNFSYVDVSRKRKLNDVHCFSFATEESSKKAKFDDFETLRLQSVCSSPRKRSPPPLIKISSCTSLLPPLINTTRNTQLNHRLRFTPGENAWLPQVSAVPSRVSPPFRRFSYSSPDLLPPAIHESLNTPGVSGVPLHSLHGSSQHDPMILPPVYPNSPHFLGSFLGPTSPHSLPGPLASSTGGLQRRALSHDLSTSSSYSFQQPLSPTIPPGLIARP